MTTTPGGILYLVGTPIGNLEDITFRAINTLKQVDLIAAEDTRHTGKLLKHFQIETPQISYHQHNRQQRHPYLIEQLQGGMAIALVTDAGMPGISDPGYELVAACIAVKIPIVPIPGVSAGITALVASGLDTERFIFEGFLPPKPKDRRDRLAQLKTEQRTLIFYESPHRLTQTLGEFVAGFSPERVIVVARELTKLHEEFWRGTLQEAQEYYGDRQVKGELTLIIAGASLDIKPLSESEIKAQLQQLISQGLSKSQASRDLAEQLQLPRRQLYQISCQLEED